MLKSTGVKRIFDLNRKAVGFWMLTVDGGIPVRIFITHEALSAIEPTQAPDATGDLDTFDAHRTDIEAAAAKKFAAGKFADFQHEGQAVIVLRDHDVT
jgi:hypothetical protein